MIFVLFLFALSIKEFLNVRLGIKRVEKIRNTNAYVSVDNTDMEKLNDLMNSEKKYDNVKKLKELYSYMINSDDVEYYTYYNYLMFETEGSEHIEQYTVDEKFLEMFDIKVLEGRNFSKDEMTTRKDETPLLVGYNLRNKYKLGQSYEIRDASTGENFKAIIVGILPYRCGFPSLNDLNQIHYLDYAYLKPLVVGEDGIETHEFTELDMAINKTVIFTDNEKTLSGIENKSKELGLFDIKFVKASVCIEDFLNTFYKGFVIQIGISLFVCILAIAVMINNLLTIISKQITEFLIHKVCGGMIRTIVMRLFIQLTTVMTISFIPTIAFFGFTKAAFYAYIIGFILIIIILVYPSVKLYKGNLVLAIREEK